MLAFVVGKRMFGEKGEMDEKGLLNLISCGRRVWLLGRSPGQGNSLARVNLVRDEGGKNGMVWRPLFVSIGTEMAIFFRLTWN